LVGNRGHFDPRGDPKRRRPAMEAGRRRLLRLRSAVGAGNCRTQPAAAAFRAACSCRASIRR